MSDVTLKRIIDLETQSEVDSSVYTIIDSPTGMGKKYPLGDLVGEVDNLKEELNQFPVSDDSVIAFIKGAYLKTADGSTATSNKYARTTDLWGGYGSRIAVVFNNPTYEFCLTFYDATGTTSGTGYLGNSGYGIGTIIIPQNAVLFGVSLRRADNTTLADSDMVAIASGMQFLACTDRTLEQSGKAADAKTVGDMLSVSRNIVPVDISSQTTTTDSGTSSGVTWTKNSENNWTAVGTAGNSASLRNIIGATSTVIDRFYPGQLLKIKVNTTDANVCVNVHRTYTINGVVKTSSVNFNKDGYIYVPETVTGLLIRLIVPSWHTVNGTISFSVTGYYNTHIYSTGDTTDRTSFINKILRFAGRAILSKGTFYVNKLNVPDGCSLIGSGSGSVLRLADGGEYAVNLYDRCSIRDLRIIGADEDITLPSSDFEPEEGETNLLSGLTWDTGDGYVRTVFSTALPAGTYKLKINVSTTNTSVSPMVRMFDQDSYSNNHTVYTNKDLPNGEYTELTVTTDSQIKSIYILAADSVSGSSGYTVTLDSIDLRTLTSLIGSRHGIVWKTAGMLCSTISNCVIERFTGGGILAKDTSTPIDQNLLISDCFIRNCGAGIYIQKDSEFHRICNCTIVNNWYGILNRGGNNNISNCGVDGNIVGIQVDNDEGSNNGHGTITGCSINHSDSNEGYGLIIKGTGRELISNCNFYYSKILLSHTNGNVISNCGFGTNGIIEVDAGSGNCNIIADCMFRDITNALPVTSGIVKLSNNWSRGGSELVPTTPSP